MDVTPLVRLSVVLAAALIAGCGSNGGSGPPAPTPPGSVVVFGTDTPVCDVESLPVTITAASLVPPQGGEVPVVASAAPATVNFARLADFTNIVATANVPPGQYNQLWIALSIPTLVILNTSASPPSAQPLAPTLVTTSFHLSITPPLVVTSGATAGITMDFNLPKSLQVGGNGVVTGTINPQITVTSNANSGSSVGEANALYGIAGAGSSGNAPSGFTGSFPLALNDGAGQTLTVLVNSSTVFEGDNVTSLSQITASTFVEVDAIVNSSGQIVAQIVDAEEPTSAANEIVALLGKVVSVTRDGSGNAISFTLFVDDEDPNIDPYLEEENSQPLLYGDLPVTLTSSTTYFTNWRQWNQQSFTFGPKTLGLAEDVAVFGAFGSVGGFKANQIFLRPRSVQGNFKTLQAAGSDNLTGGFTLTPCSGLFGGQAITVLSYPDSVFNGLSGLTALTTAPTLNTVGLLSYQPVSGTATTGGSWTAPTWVMQARQVHQLPN